MSQATGGLRKLLNSPAVYRAQQWLVGAGKLHRVTRDYLALEPGQRLLDVGCGPADILALLPDIEYVGVDLSPTYIEAAEARFGTRGRFLAGSAEELPRLVDQKFDVVLAQGVLHHLGDEEAVELLRFGATKLAPGGRFVTCDVCYRDGQGPIECYLIDHDRGENVRDAAGYRALAERAFAHVRCDLRTDLLRFPYTLCFMTASA